MKPSLVHLSELVITISLAIVLLFTVTPYAAHAFFSPPLRDYNNLRLEPFYYLTGALIPVALWFVPALARRLATSAFKGHKYFFGRSGFYVRFSTRRSLQFRTTLLMSLSPFAIDMLAIVEIEHFFGNLTLTN